MTTTLNLEQVIWQNLQGLSTESLKEIAAFILFVRKKNLFPEQFEQELWVDFLQQETAQLSHAETSHLENEFENYEELYPKCE
jgi:hypothetical protein